MARPLRLSAPGLLHHVFARGDNKRSVFEDDDDNRAFLALLGSTLARFGVDAAGYCLMWNHYHLLLVPYEPTAISRLMQQLNSAYCQRFNRRHGRVGHVLQGRFGCRIVEDGCDARSVLRYVALNPVAAGQARRPEDWPWSSYRMALGLEASPDFLALRYVWAPFGTADPETGRSRLAAFVAADVEEAFANSLLHGSVRLHEELAPELELRGANRDFTYDQRFATRPPLGALLEGCTDRHSIDTAVHAAFSRHGYTLAELGRALSRDPSTVCRWIQRAQARRRQEGPGVTSEEDRDAKNKI